jgi:exonuclease III
MILRQVYDHAANSRFVRAPMKIASFNINNINRRLTNLLDWIRESDPDIVCLQKLKSEAQVRMTWSVTSSMVVSCFAASKTFVP